ncbi:protein YgfX [Aliamphritea hakodatensis]|uniref:protein YgfX n=1 Tax=Aliamphritea hakodatensis TaxID=2895352 RepID=UPI0022FD4EB8|nr:protein YgfX [Aliamphritea hakodatensis]
MSSLLQIKFSPSRQLGVLYSGLASIAYYSIWLLHLPWFLNVVFSVLLGGLFVTTWRRYISLTHDRSVIALHWQAKDKYMRLCTASGEWLTVASVEQRILWPWLTALRVRVDGSGKEALNLIVLSDSLSDFSQYRQFRVFCRYARIKGGLLPTG